MLKQDILTLTNAELFITLSSSENGLSTEDAALRLKTYGANQFQKYKVTWTKILLRQLQSPLIYMLGIASVISYATKSYSDGTIILIILIINTLLGFFQEYKSEKIIEKLSQLICKHSWLKRDGKLVSLEQTQIVPGDVIIIKPGEIVPADLRLVWGNNLIVDESQLTGESAPVIKSLSADLSQESLIFAGSVITHGDGAGIVYATGNNSELGIIAKLSSQTKKITQYEKSLQALSGILVKIVVFSLVLVFIFKLILNGGISNIPELFLFVIALAVAVIPEVLPVIATVTLSRAAIMLAKKHVIVKRLSALEDLGNVNLLCTDKTGTLTENKMTVNSITAEDEMLFQKFLFAIIPPNDESTASQNSYDNAFMHYIPDHIKLAAKNLSIVKEFPFDPYVRQRRVILKDAIELQYYLIVIGAPEVLLDIASCDNQTEYLDGVMKKGKEGLHNLGMAYQRITYPADFDILKNETNLLFLGYVSLYDKLRDTVKTTIAHAHKLGVQLKILTGDSKEVAYYVARQVGLLNDDKNKIYLGSELEAMSDTEFTDAVNTCNVFARVSPSQKYDIIKVAKEKNVVAYQGDGINDAPALKMADVAIAVNSATDIAKENADIILLDKNLGVIINGIRYGRNVFININKYIKYTMISNFGNLIAIAVLYLFVSNLPLLPVQLLLMAFITDIPLIMISFDHVADDEVLSPEKHDMKELIIFSMILGLPTALFTLFYYMLIRSQPQIYVETSLYAFFTLSALSVFYTVRTKRNFWNGGKIPLIINIAFALAFIVSMTIMYIPLFQRAFSFVPLSLGCLASVIITVVCYLFAIDFVKILFYNKMRYT